MSQFSAKDLALINDALAHEYFGVAAYEGAIATGLLEPGVVQVARNFQLHHHEHAAKLRSVLRDAGGTPVQPKSREEYFAELPVDQLTDQAEVLRYAASLEKEAAISYLAQVGQLEDRELAMIMASISGDEAMHYSVLRGALGLDPVPFAFIPVLMEADA